MRNKRRPVFKLYPYIIQIGVNREVLYINYATDIDFAFMRFLHRHTRLRDSKLRNDLFDSSNYYPDVRRVERACNQMINVLEQQGYEFIAGGPLHNPFWQVYAIEIGDEPGHVYVGETNYPVEKRFQQHVYKFNPARVLLNYDSFELAMNYVNNFGRYFCKEDSLKAEAEAADRLRKLGLHVEGGH